MARSWHVVGWRGWRLFGSLEIDDGVVTSRVVTGAVLVHRAREIGAFKVRSQPPGARRMLALIDDRTGREVHVYPSWTRQYGRLVAALTDAGFVITDQGTRAFGGFPELPRRRS
jgi:hypothetical protein